MIDTALVLRKNSPSNRPPAFFFVKMLWREGKIGWARAALPQYFPQP
jgi:hypothetical protein